MKLPWVKLSAFLLLGLGAAIYLWWRFSDSQSVLRQTDALFESATVQRISFADADKALELFRSVVGDSITFAGADPIPNKTLSEDEAVTLLKNFRESVGGSKIRRLETTVTFPGPDKAWVEALIESDISWDGGRRHNVDRFKAELHFERSPEGWILTQAIFMRRSGK
ncbi:MAG: hypothetical protein OSA48_00460 [Akkermansiaceae bacterium]|nr:hypothetical protein [Akkermansiaceae bacterium]